MNTVYLNPEQVPQFMRGDYTGRTFKAIICTTVDVPAGVGQWDSGSREQFSFLVNGMVRRIGLAGRINLHPGIIVMRRSWFSGRDMGITYYVHPQGVAKALPQLDMHESELSRDMRLVLTAVRSFKSKHNGKDRYTMTMEECDGYMRQFPDRADWDIAVRELKTLNMLTATGAITVLGKNACRRYHSVRSVFAEMAS